ncbi:dehydrogenase/reductase [Lophiostoma macrostomum CBS 122681]|uniref:Dehydrogenase/reductase n=1 Tax=Lophiostoma macrostomum CBS 122681 TaxID=1314788 RepID=A0A6A6TQG9_9PLEO|nr:dehydrogenase/reductase [Lophiostoma macrostomum CBS 122681]
MTTQAYNSTILITGGTQGMGYHTSLSIAKQRPQSLVVIASRTDSLDAATQINKQLKQSNVRYVQLDLGSLAKVRKFVGKWKGAGYPRIEVLVLNAAVQIWGDVNYTDDGIEKQFGVNHVGHALLYHLLQKDGCLGEHVRIVITSSGVHDPREKWGKSPDWTTAEEIARPDEASRKKRDGMERYSESKVANVLWMYALAKRVRHSQKTVVAFDPGLMPGTGLQRDANPVVKWMFVSLFPLVIPLLQKLYRENVHSPKESGESLAWLAVGQEGKGKSGAYYEARREKETSVLSRREDKQEDLWRWTVDFVAQDAEERVKFDGVD